MITILPNSIRPLDGMMTYWISEHRFLIEGEHRKDTVWLPKYVILVCKHTSFCWNLLEYMSYYENEHFTIDTNVYSRTSLTTNSSHRFICLVCVMGGEGRHKKHYINTGSPVLKLTNANYSKVCSFQIQKQK